jgi:hypothetical protein
MYGGDPCLLKLMFEAKIEVGGIDTDEDVRPLSKPTAFYVAIRGQQARHALERINITKNSQYIHAVPRIQPLSLHGRASYALAHTVRNMLAYPVYDASGQ